MVKLLELFDNNQLLLETRIGNEEVLRGYLKMVSKGIFDKPDSYKFMNDQLYKIISRDRRLYVYPRDFSIKTRYDRKDAENGSLVDIKLGHGVDPNTINHIADWLKDAPNQTNLRGIQSFEIAEKMADAYFAKKNRGASAEDDVSGLKSVFRDGPYLWVQVISKQALDREGKLMQHCVGSYAERVAQDHCQIYSLRDKNNQPHCTIEISSNTVQQIKGKQNSAPNEKYWSTCRDFIKHMKFKMHDNGDAKNIGIIAAGDKLITIEEFSNTENIDHQGNLRLKKQPGLVKIPNGLKVGFDLDLVECDDLKTIGENLNIGQSLTILNCSKLFEIGKNENINKMLFIKDCNNLKTIGQNLSIGEDLIISDCNQLKTLPNNIKIGGSLILTNSNILELPESLTQIVGDLKTKNTKIKNIGNIKKIYGNLDATNSEIEYLPDNLYVYGYLALRICDFIKKLPRGLVLSSHLYLQLTQITELPDDLKMSKNSIIYGFSGDKSKYPQYNFA